MGTLAEEAPYQYRRPMGQTLLFPRNWDYLLWDGMWNREGSCQEKKSCYVTQVVILSQYDLPRIVPIKIISDGLWFMPESLHPSYISKFDMVGLRPKALEEGFLIRVLQYIDLPQMVSRCAKLLLCQPLGQPSRTWVSGAPGKVASGQEHPPQYSSVCPTNIRYSCSFCALRLDRLRRTVLEDFGIAFLPCLILSLYW